MMTAYAFTPWGYIWASENPFLLYFEVFRLFTQMMSYVIFMTSLFLEEKYVKLCFQNLMQANFFIFLQK